MTNFRDIEQLSSYLDGQLKTSEAVRLESRIQTDPELATLLDELRQTRALFRQLPQRRAPHNFTLTPKMVGQRPPLPSSYPLFRFASMLATLLLFFSFAVNFVGPRLAMRSMPLYGYGGGGGDAEVPELAMEAAPAEEMPSVASEPMTEEPAAPAEAPAPVATQMPEGTGEATTRVEPTLEVAAKNGEPEQAQADSEAMGEPLPVVPAEPIPVAWQIGLGILALANIVIVVIMRKSAVSKWQK